MNTGIVKLSPELLELISKSSGGNAIMPFTREIFLLDIVVAGTTYCKEIDEIESFLVAETVLKMQRDVKNEYDKNAIALYYNDIRIGWIPRELNLIISRLMDAGKAFFCRVNNAERKNKWLKVEAKIYMVE